MRPLLELPTVGWFFALNPFVPFLNLIREPVTHGHPQAAMACLAAALLTLTILPAQSAFGVSKEIVQLQTQVQDLQDQMTKISTSFNERMVFIVNLL